jgi:hypothetical protein
MKSKASSEAVVVLKGGFVASLRALRLGWALEARGFTLSSEGTRLCVRPADQLTHEDILAIRATRDELLAIVQYLPPEEVE